jgi:hypothetical protein
MGYINFLPGLTWNLNPPDLHLQSSWDYRVSHHTQPKSEVFKPLLPFLPPPVVLMWNGI